MKTFCLIIITFLFSLFAHAASEKPTVKTWGGLLKTGVMAIGGETTGVTLKTKKGPTYELDLGKNGNLITLADKLNDKVVVVTGVLEIRKGVEIKERQIIAVTALREVAEAAKPLKEIDPANLCQHWVQSPKEQQPGDKDQLFRPKDFKKFPPGRFRMAYKFAANGDCEWLYLDPSDAHRFKSGKWTVDPKDKTVLQITTNGTTVSYRVNSLTKELLRLTPIESKDN